MYDLNVSAKGQVMNEINYDKVPVPKMTAGLKRYIERGIKPGDFLFAVLLNDFVGAVSHADEDNAAALKAWASFVYFELPRGSWGSAANVRDWIEGGGLEGLDRREQQQEISAAMRDSHDDL